MGALIVFARCSSIKFLHLPDRTRQQKPDGCFKGKIIQRWQINELLMRRSDNFGWMRPQLFSFNGCRYLSWKNLRNKSFTEREIWKNTSPTCNQCSNQISRFVPILGLVHILGPTNLICAFHRIRRRFHTSSKCQNRTSVSRLVCEIFESKYFFKFFLFPDFF